MRRLTLAFVSVLFLASPIAAHEFWIDPESHVIAPGQSAVANIRVGESFKGLAQSYFTRGTERFDVIMNGEIVDPEPILGDRPALNAQLPGEGLAIVVYETTDSRLTYTDWQKFVNFVEHKAFDGALERHVERQLPETGFVETYRRYAKSLIAVGDGVGEDVVVGLETEIVAMANPYTDDMSAGLPVRVMLRGEPRANAQVETYSRGPDGVIRVTLTRTDDEGIARVPAVPGYAFMVDAVVLEEREGDAVWHSMWANLTYAVPE
ncbi:MAG: DUF4198 domain-containing protein [Pseudomonadota bacterium]